MLKFHELEVIDVQPSGNAGITLSLAIPSDLKKEFTHSPGQHLVILRTIEGEEQRRSYSIISVPGAEYLQLAVRRHEHGLVSNDLFAHLKVNDWLQVLEPNGSFIMPTEAANQKIVGFAAGSGITPILGLANGLLAAGRADKFVLFLCNQNTDRTLCATEVLELKDRYPDKFAVHFLMTRETQEFELLNGRLDAVKVATFCSKVVDLQTLDQAFLSGPGDMMANLASALEALGIGTDKIHSEHYSLDSVVSTSRNKVVVEPSAASAGSVAVAAIIDGRRREFSLEEGETLLEAGLNAGVELPFSCCAGVCSTCRVKVVEGEVVMDENYALEDWEVEEGYVLACQSRPCSETVVLDYDER